MSQIAAKTHAEAIITVLKYEPAPYDQPSEGPVLSRIHVEESFAGDISGDGVVEFLQSALPDGTASFVGIERVNGTVGGRRGSCLLLGRASGIYPGNPQPCRGEPNAQAARWRLSYDYESASEVRS